MDRVEMLPPSSADYILPVPPGSPRPQVCSSASAFPAITSHTIEPVIIKFR